jgi:hypothetical protein
MPDEVGYREWTWGRQAGLRIYTETIRNLREVIHYPSVDGAFENLSEWLDRVEAGLQPARFARPIAVVLPDRQIEQARLTISVIPRRGLEGHITAPVDSAFEALVRANLSRNVEAHFESAPTIDTILLQPDAPDAICRMHERAVHRALRRLQRPVPADATAQGWYFESIEFDRRRLGAPAGYTVDWRAPWIESRLPAMRARGISCDIDIWDASQRPMVCVEVKSVAGAPTGAFVLTRRELESRDICASLQIVYEIVVYGFSRSSVDHRVGMPSVRRVVSPACCLHTEPDSYRCW